VKVIIIIIIVIIIIPLVTSVSLCSLVPYFTMPPTHFAVISPRNKPTVNSRQNNRTQAPKIVMFYSHFLPSFVCICRGPVPHKIRVTDFNSLRGCVKRREDCEV